MTDDFDKYDEPRLHMERLLRAKLIEFDISIRILIHLEDAGIKTLGDLTRQTRKSLRRVNQLGKISIDILEQLLHRYGLTFATK